MSNDIERSDYRTYSNQWSTNVIDYLETMINDPSLLQSLLVELIKPAGITDMINYNLPIDDRTRFFYYTYQN